MNKEFKQVLGVRVEGAPFTVLRFLQGLRISQVYSTVRLHRLDICIPWSYQLYFSSEYAQRLTLLIAICLSFYPLTSRVSCTFLVQISCRDWPGLISVLQMSLINWIETGRWDPITQSDKSPCPRRHCPFT